MYNNNTKTQYNNQNNFYKGTKNMRNNLVTKNEISDNQFINDLRLGFKIYREEINNAILTPNPEQLAKFEVVKNTLLTIAREHNGTVKLSTERETSSGATLRTHLITKDDFVLLSKISNIISAISIDATLNGVVEVGVTVPNTYIKI